MSAATAAPVLAAGAVCWRRRPGGIEVLLIRRDRHDDISLPKGKVDDGESVPAAAVREVLEETGYGVRLGMPLGTAEYQLPGGRDKIVYYWAAEVAKHELAKGRFRPSDEVQAVQWVPVAKAAKRLSYVRDADLVTRFAQLAEQGAVGGPTLIALRHGAAVQPPFDGPDRDRPLTPRGKQQAKAIVGPLAAFGVDRILTSPAKRCRSTVQPLAKATGVAADAEPSLAQDAWDAPTAALGRTLEKRIAEAVAHGGSTVFCCHSPVLPEVVDRIAARTVSSNDGRLLRAAILGTAEFTVLHLAAVAPHRIVAVETHAPVS